MATTANAAWVTQTDLYKTIGPDKKVQAVAQTLMTYNEIMQDMIYTEANGQQFHQATQQAVLPTVNRSKINEMITPTKALHDQVTFVLERIESVLAIDKRLLELNPDSAAFKAIQSKSHMQAISEQLATDIFYANTNQDETQAMGLASLYSDINNSKYGDQIISAGGDGAGAQTSIWFMDWDDTAVTAIYPPGTKAGIDFEDLGDNLLGNHTDGFMRAEAAWFSVRWGLSVINPKHVVRIANVDVADMTAKTVVGIPEFMISAEERMPPNVAGNRRIYMNRLARESLRIEARKEANVFVQLGWDNFMGKQVLMWNGIPIRRCDAIVNTETIVAAV